MTVAVTLTEELCARPATPEICAFCVERDIWRPSTRAWMETSYCHNIACH